MGLVDGLTKARMLAIEAASVVSGTVNGSNRLILTKFDGSTIDAGSVIGPQGPTGAGLTIVNAATLDNITLSGTQTIDGVALGANALVLVKNQTNAPDNGIYTVLAGAWTRATIADTTTEVAALGPIHVRDGSQQAGTIWESTFKPGNVLGTANMFFQQISYAQSYARVATTTNITRSGTQTIDGVNPGIGARVLVKNQTNGLENGLFIMSTGAWQRAPEANSGPLVSRLGVVQVQDGATQAGTRWGTTFKYGQVTGTDAMNWYALPAIPVDFSRHSFGENGTKLLGTVNAFSDSGDWQWAFPGYNQDESFIAYVSGLVLANAAVAANAAFYQLPPTHRPSRELMFNTCVSGTITRIKVDASGNISCPAGLAASAYMSLDEIRFPNDAALNIPWVDLTSALQAGWTNYDAAHSVRGWVDSVGDLHLQGWVKATGSSTASMLQLPTSMWNTTASNTSMFLLPTLDSANSCVRVDITAAGTLIPNAYMGSGTSGVGICLDGIIVPAATMQANDVWRGNAFTNSWTNYGAGFHNLNFYRNPNGRMFVRGLIKSGTVSNPVCGYFSNPYAKPAYGQMVLGVAGPGVARIDVSPLAGAGAGTGIQVSSYGLSGSNIYVSMHGMSWDTRIR